MVETLCPDTRGEVLLDEFGRHLRLRLVPKIES